MSAKTLSPEEEAEQRDAKLLAENSAKIEEIMKLLQNGDSRGSADERAQTARGRVAEAGGGGRGAVFHPHQGKRVPVGDLTSRYLELCGALELQIKTREHGADLLRSLHGAAQTRVTILERCLARLEK
jgi:hypothetical protein